MYFKTYTPSTKSENCETARAFHTYNAVRNFCGKDEPRFPDFVAYRLSKMGMEGFFIELIPEEMSAFETSLKPEWADIKEAVRNAGQPLRSQYVAYFALLENGMKPGETKDIVQRYSNINRDTPIRKMWYINVESKEQARAAEHALHMIFDHARCMNRQQNKKDYYECDPESAEKFLTANMKKIFELIVAEVAKVEG
jgi:hypothetical protein